MNSGGRSRARRSAVDDWDLQVLGDQHDSLAHVLQRELKLLGLLPRLGLGAQDLLHGRQDQQGQHEAGDGVDLQSWTTSA